MVEIKMKEDEVMSIREEIIRVRKIREATLNKLTMVETQKAEIEKDKEELQCQISKLERENELQRKLTEAERKRYEDSVRERDVLTKMKTHAEDWGRKHASMLRLKETIIINLEAEIQQYKDAAVKQDHVIDQLEKERLKASAEVSEATAKYLKLLDKIQEKEMEIMEASKKVEISELAIKQQKALFEVVRNEKNIYSKRWVDTQDEINQSKRKLQVSTQMVESLKEQLLAMDSRIEKGAADVIKVEKEKEALGENLVQFQGKIKNVQGKIEKYVLKIQNHELLVDQAKEELERLRKEYSTVKTERDSLATQLSRREEELSHVYMKVRTQQSTLDKGRVHYLDRLNELRELKLKLNELKREQAVLKGSLNSIGILKREIHCLGRELMKERLKVRIMTEELETPQNVHRWRIMEAADPPLYEMITKVQTLQKRLIVKSDEVVERDLLIREKEKLYLELQKILARQPGPEATQRINDLTRNLCEKTKQLKAMSSELYLYQSRVKEYRAEIDELKEQLKIAKRSYIESKERQILEKQRDKISTPPSGRNPTPKKVLKAPIRGLVKKTKVLTSL
ncbi:hypothetical protein R1flu_002823 [Riccia fluitans]|uniref:Cilia- and flagella-associated protein 58 central coiled coil domain-containing protein n=1 Tax=Riccia fluitans TaxID=41844 RepID=A0ABD1Y776_9MARC